LYSIVVLLIYTLDLRSPSDISAGALIGAEAPTRQPSLHTRLPNIEAIVVETVTGFVVADFKVAILAFVRSFDDCVSDDANLADFHCCSPYI